MTDALWKPNRPLVACFFFVSAAGLLLMIVLNILSNGASESAVLFGLSTERLVLLGGMFAIAMGLTYLAWQIAQGKPFKFLSSESEKRPSRSVNFMLGATLLVFLLAWSIIWTPAERFGTFYYYLGRLYPFIVWLTCFSAVGLFLLFTYRFGLNLEQFKVFLREQRIVFTIAGVALLIFGLLAVVASFRVVNMRWFEEDFWYGAGVPILVLQVLLAVFVSTLLAVVARKVLATKNFEKKYWFDLVLFLAIWAVAASMWASEPANPDFFITEPAAPNYELYPDYDARFFDLFSQYALIGQGLDNGGLYDRPLYSAFLLFLHTFVGQNYAQVVAWQAALFAVFPALGYLLGRQLHSRAVGLGVAILFTLRGVNAIALGPFINTAHQKQLMTDFPSAIFMLLMTLLLIRWLRAPGKNWPSLAWAAGVLGLATLLRPHPLIYIPILIAFVTWVYRSQKRLWITFSGVILVAALAGVLPWVVANGHGQSVFDLYFQKIKNVIDSRYPGLHLPGSSMLPEPVKVAALDNALYAVHLPSENVGDKSIFAFSLDNFLNNLTTTVQVLPYSPYYQDLRYTTKTAENFWRPYWDGSISPWGRIFLPVNLILLALGLGAAWKRARWGGFIPLMVMLAYDAMNAFARTSGGRYIVPVDWVVILYYFLGIIALIELVSALFFRPDASAQTNYPAQLHSTVLLDRRTWAHMLGIIFSFVLIGSLIPLSASSFKPRYPSLTRAELVQQVIKESGKQLGLSNQEWKAFLSSPQAMIVQGRILYPRQLEKDVGGKASIYNLYHPKPYPRTIFTLIGPNGETPGMLASMQGAAIPNVSDAIILGCRESGFLQVWAVFLNDGSQLIKRTPATAAASLVCPLQEPVCDNNHHCR
jgi:hypothetical protein